MLVISLDEAAARSNNDSSSDEPEKKDERVDNEDFISTEVSKGNELFVRSFIDGIYGDFNDSSEEFGTTRGSIFTAITFVPNPYEDKGIVDLYGGYLNLSIYMIVLFIFGALTKRSLARTKLGKQTNLSQSAFIGGIAMCCFALVANILYAGTLDVIEALNEFIMLPVMPEIVPNPDNLLLYALMGLCDLLVFGFFVIRYYILYIVAVVCSVIAVCLVPEFTRDFAKDCIEKIVRILFLQPAALFVSVVCIIATENLPDFLKIFSYVGTTIVIFLTCWYFLFGDFKLLKQGVQFAIRKGVLKV